MSNCISLGKTLLAWVALGAALFEVQAQDLQSPKQFYSKGFVNQNSSAAFSSSQSRGALHEEKNFQGKSSDRDNSTSHDEGSFERFGEKEGSFASQSSSSSSSTEEDEHSISNEEQGISVKSLSLLINAADIRYLIKYYSELLEISKQFSIPLLDVYVLGDAKKLLADKEFLSLRTTPQSGNLRYIKKLPEKFSMIKRSPAVFIELETGVVILEAFPSLRPAFNSQGQFIEPAVK